MSDTQKARVDRILEKLASVRERGLSCFGSESHDFQLNPPLQESAIADFESEHGIELPPDYRAFLKYAGNGGAGPYYGIYPLERWAGLGSGSLGDLPAGFLRLPCPLHPDLEPRDDWEEEFEGVCPYGGTMSIGTQGCTFVMQLVVSGAYRGRVVYADEEDSPPYMVRNKDFLEWYERWLDELLAGYDTDWFGYGQGGTEEDLLKIIDDRTASERDRDEAVEGICRLPELTEIGRRSIRGLLSDSSATIRASGCRAVRLCKVPDAEQTIAALLDDESSEVREEAVRTLMERDASRWSDKVTARLDDDNGDVASAAYFGLEKNEYLKKADLLRLINKSPHPRLRSSAVYGCTWEREDEHLIISLLRDENSSIRLYATFALRRIKSTASIPAVIEMLDREDDYNVIGCALKMLGELGGVEARESLLKWSQADDDFYRLDAVDGLSRLGDERVTDVAREMLKEHTRPGRSNLEDPSQPDVDTISRRVAKSLRNSPNPSLRRLGSG